MIGKINDGTSSSNSAMMSNKANNMQQVRTNNKVITISKGEDEQQQCKCSKKQT
jgi:hypothetical protein